MQTYISTIIKQDMNVLTVLSVLGLSVVVMCSHGTFHIVPFNSTEGCDVKPCLTLDQLARVVNTPNLTSLTLHFLPGNHILSQRLLHINNKKAVKIIGSFLDTTIWLQGTNFSISNVENLAIENITLTSNNEQIVNVVINSYSCSKFWLRRSTINSVNIELKIITSCIVTADQLFGTENVGFQTTLFPSQLLIIHCDFDHSSVLVSFFDSKIVHALKTYIIDSNVYQGRGIKIRGQFYGQMYLTNCKFEENHQQVVEIQKSTRIIITNSTFINNQGICSFHGKYLEVINCNFSGSQKCNYVLGVSANQMLIMSNKFINNNCRETVLIDYFYSPYLAFGNGSIHINDCSFVNNHAFIGGGISKRLIGYNSLIFITNCEFTANHADYCGGAIYSVNEMIVSDSTFTNISAKVGGAVFISKGTFAIINCTYIDNYVTSIARFQRRDKTGAAIFASLLQIEFVIRNTIFTKNFGSETVAIVGSKSQMNNITFLDNGQKPENDSRGCLYLFDTRLNITGPVTLSGNVGGGIYAIQSQIYINSTEAAVISNNTAISG